MVNASWFRLVAIVCGTCSPLTAGISAEVRVDATRSVVLGTVDEISPSLFGITAFEGFPRVLSDRDERGTIAALRPGCFRFPGNVSWFAPKSYDPSWYESPGAAMAFERSLLFGARYPYGRILPVVRQMGAEPMISLGAPPDYLKYGQTRNPDDFDRWAEYCAAYVGLWRRFDPKLRFVQVWNEPNANWFKDPRSKSHGQAQLFIEMANKVAAALKRRFPDLQVGGPTLCWPPAWPPGQKGQKPWYTWEQWTLPWLKLTKDHLDFFDFHDYQATPAELQVQVEMLHAAALQLQGRPLPIWITESNAGLQAPADAAAMWRDRILPYERWLLKGLLPQADKVAGNLYHDLAARRHRLGRVDHGPYWLLWVLRDLRGRRVVADSDDRQLVTFATLEQDRITVVLFNDMPQSRQVSLQVRMPCGWWTGPDVRAIGSNNQGACEAITIAHKLDRPQNHIAQGTITLPAFATASVSFRMDRFGAPKNRRVVQEYLAEQTLQFLKPGAPVLLTIPVTDSSPGRLALRLGLLDPEGDEQLVARLNGRQLPVVADVLQEISLEPQLLQPQNQLEIRVEATAVNPRLAVGFASIVVTCDE